MAALPLPSFTLASSGNTRMACVELAARLDDPRVRVLDLRASVPHTSTYDDGHIRGAVHLDLDVQGIATGKDHPSNAIELLVLASVMSTAGVDDGQVVVAYDDDDDGTAARFVEMLRRVGHAEAYALDGGFVTWRSRKLSIDRKRVAPKPGSFTARRLT